MKVIRRQGEATSCLLTYGILKSSGWLCAIFSAVLSLPRDILVVAPELTGFSTPADSNRRFPIIFGCEMKLQSL
jgi:hypothetical protein